MAKITVVASLLALMFCVMISGCGSPYKAANYEDIVVGEKVCPYLSSDADMRGIPGAWSTVTAIQGEKPNQWVYLTHGDGSGGWGTTPKPRAAW